MLTLVRSRKKSCFRFRFRTVLRMKHFRSLRRSALWNYFPDEMLSWSVTYCCFPDEMLLSVPYCRNRMSYSHRCCPDEMLP